MELTTVRIAKPETVNFVLGQARSIEVIERIHEALVSALTTIRFGVACCEPAGKRLVRCIGTDASLLELAKKNGAAIGAGDTFIVFFEPTVQPRDLLPIIRDLPEVCGIYCATANSTEVIVVTTEQGRGVVGVVDGSVPNGVESDEDIAWRKDYLLHVVGYRR